MIVPQTWNLPITFNQLSLSLFKTLVISVSPSLHQSLLVDKNPLMTLLQFSHLLNFHEHHLVNDQHNLPLIKDTQIQTLLLK